VNASLLADYLNDDMRLADLAALDTDQLAKLEQGLHHWDQLAQRELRERARLAKEEEAE
jgi:hypothetical protein